jgi:hypothetical protein
MSPFVRELPYHFHQELQYIRHTLEGSSSVSEPTELELEQLYDSITRRQPRRKLLRDIWSHLEVLHHSLDRSKCLF